MSQKDPHEPASANIGPVAAAGGPTPAPFFAVTIFKLALLSLLTFGIYDVYWFYRNWQIIKAREGIDISPFWRTFFALFFCYQLFCRVRDYRHPAVSPGSLPAGLLTAGWIILGLLWDLPDPWWMVTSLSFVFILPVQERANQINRAVEPLHDPNGRLTGSNWLGVILGAILWILIILVLLLNPMVAETI